MSCQAMRTFDVLTIKASPAVLPHWFEALSHRTLTVFAGDLFGGFGWPHSLPRGISKRKGTAVSIKPSAAPITCLIIKIFDECTLIHSLLRMIDFFLM